ncbi:MAG: helix-turn-helix domain-containing protein, partial [Alphaproteobacteria bacterium]
MVEQKIFAGPRLRRLRTRLGRTQSQMAAEIGISASYLNLIERNQRPLTVQVILKLSSTFDFDISELHSADAGARLDELKAIFADPLLAAELPSTDELGEVADAAPNVGIAITKLHRAYRETLARLTELTRDMAGLTAELPPELQRDKSPDKPAAGAGVSAALLPHDRVTGWFETEGPWFADLEVAADEQAASLAPRDDPFGAIKTALARDHHIDVRILPVDTMPAELSRFDRHAMRLYLSERLPLIERPFFAAIQLVAMAERQRLDRLADGAGLE